VVLARYARVAETSDAIGFITPLTHNFCEGCNRVRVTAAAVLYTCLGQEDAVDLKAVMRGSTNDRELMRVIDLAIQHKRRVHDFVSESNRCSAGACTSHVRQADEQQASSQIIKLVTTKTPRELSS
jgi:GTP 3',8-cyclase